MKSKRLTKDEKEKLFELYKTYKYTYKELAEMFNKTTSSISCLLNREGLKGKREFNHFRKYPIDQNFFDVIDTEGKAYFLGLLCADGCNHKNSTKVSMWLKESDRDILETFRLLLQPEKPLSYGIKKVGSNQYGIQISNKRISDKLSELGCIPNKTFNLDFPSPDQVPEYLMKHYLRGFFDGDGWLGLKDISITASTLFCKKLYHYLLSNFKVETRLRAKGKVTELIFRREGARIFLHWIYNNSNIKLKRKFQRYTENYV